MKRLFRRHKVLIGFILLLEGLNYGLRNGGFSAWELASFLSYIAMVLGAGWCVDGIVREAVAEYIKTQRRMDVTVDMDTREVTVTQWRQS